MFELASVASWALRVWLKIDSGMHCAGFLPAQVQHAHNRLRASDKVQAFTLGNKPGDTGVAQALSSTARFVGRCGKSGRTRRDARERNLCQTLDSGRRISRLLSGLRGERADTCGLVAVGYVDGFPRSAGTGTAVTANGRSSRVIDRVSMDMMTVDLTSIPDARIGSSVELCGPRVPVNVVTSPAGTIAAEVLCNVERVPLRYVGE